MMRFVKGKRKRFRDRRGMTISELLIAVAILGFVALGAVIAINLGVSQYRESVRQSEAQKLYSTLETVLTNELRYTSSLTYAEGGTETDGYRQVETVFSVTYAVKNHDTKLVSLNADGEEAQSGELAFGYDGEYNRILGSAAYTEDLAVSGVIYYNSTQNRFLVELTIEADGRAYVDRKTFPVRCLGEVRTGE